MAKGNKTIFYCSQCGYESAKWMGQCPACKEWNSFVEEPAARKSSSGMHSSGAKDITPVSLSAVSAKTEDRMSSGMSELDRVLGGGVVPGSLVLVGGDPGIGKSTLLLQVCRNMANNGKKIWYISGEESLQQIRLRAERIGSVSDRFQLICETSLSDIAEVIRRGKPEAVVIDSIQTMYSDDISSAPGSVSQIRQATAVFMQLAKTGQIGNVCQANALITLKEFLTDYGSERAKKAAETLYKNELAKIPHDKVRALTETYLSEIEEGKRDFRF